jgi:hypothetical protein
MFAEIPPPPTFTSTSIRPGDPWPDLSAQKHAVLNIIAGNVLPAAFDQAGLAARLGRSCGVFLAIGEPAWRWTMRAIRAVANERELPALAVIVECSADVDLLWLEVISKHSRCLGMTEAPLPSLPRLLN